MNPELPVGAMILRHIPGWGGRAVAAMQGFVRGGSFWTHAGLVLDHGEYIQGQPHGARIYPVSDLFDGQPLLVSDAPIQTWLARLPSGLLIRIHDDPLAGIVADARARVAAAGRKLDGADYSYLSYPVLGLAEWMRAHPDGRAGEWVLTRLREYVNGSGHLICSALVDRAYLNAGIHLFTGWMPGDVTPEDLATYAYMAGCRPLIDTREN